MLWLLVLGSSCIAGFLIGRRFRVPAALAASAVAGVAAVAAGAFARASAADTLSLAVSSIGCLQIAYLGGVRLSPRRRARPDPQSRDEDVTTL